MFVVSTNTFKRRIYIYILVSFRGSTRFVKESRVLMLTYLDAINLLENSINAFLDKGPKGMGNQAVSLSELLANHGIEDSDTQSKVANRV